MATLSISIPDDLNRLLEDRARDGGFSSVSEYLRVQLGNARERWARRERVDALLLEGLGSGPASEMTRADWKAVREEVHRRQSEREG